MKLKETETMKKMILAALAALLPALGQAEIVWKRCDVASTTGAYGQYPSVTASVKVGVWPVALGHSVGAIWTADNWRTVQWAFGSWCWNEPSPTGTGDWDESWRVHWSLPEAQASSFQYAIFVQDALGNLYWDNNHGWNHELPVEALNLRAEYLWSCHPLACD